MSAANLARKLSRRNFLKRSGQVVGGVLATGFLGFDLTQLAAQTDAGDASHKLIILHTNDMHGRIEEADGIMGMEYVRSIVRDFRKRYQNVLVLDAGDTIHGRPITNELNGSSTVDCMNAVGYDIMTPGNHDFHFHYERLLELEGRWDLDLISANTFKDGELLFRPYVIKEIGGYRVGVFGLATPATRYTTHPDNVRELDFGSITEATERYVRELREQDVDLVISLGHVGFGANNPDDVELLTSNELLKHVDGVDLFVDGHSHDRLPEGEWHGGALVVQAYEYLKDVGVVEVDFSNGQPQFSASLISAAEATDNYEPDLEVSEILKEARQRARERILGVGS